MGLAEISPQGANGLFRVVIETVRGSRNKYSYDPDLATFVLKKVLPEGHVFPFDFGFIPQTKGEDGDPLDVLVIMDAPGIAGCVVECRMIGLLQAEQSDQGKLVRNDRFIAVAGSTVNFKRCRDVSDLPEEMVEQVRHFFESHNEVLGIEFKPLKLLGAAAAEEAIRSRAGEAYAE